MKNRGKSKPPTLQMKSRSFTLLEIMIGIALLAIASSTIFWRLQKMVEKNRFDSDIHRLQSTLISTRCLAINKKMDFRLELRHISSGWSSRIICREDPDLVYPLPRFSDLEIAFNQGPLQEFSIDFYSSGFSGPKGILSLSKGNQIREFKFPELFYKLEDLPLIPMHPSELK